MTNRQGVTAVCPCSVCICCGFCDWWYQIETADIGPTYAEAKKGTDNDENLHGAGNA